MAVNPKAKVNLNGMRGRKQKLRLWFLIAGALCWEAACSKPLPEVSEVDRGRFATIKDIMHSLADPSGDFIFESVQQISDSQGIREKAPKTEEEWAQVRHHLLILSEIPDLITMRSRHAARPEDRSSNPAVESEPEEVQRLIDADRSNFERRARMLQAAVALGLKAVDAKDKDALFKAADRIDKACENCHLHYWYPNDKRAQEAAKEDGVTDE